MTTTMSEIERQIRLKVVRIQLREPNRSTIYLRLTDVQLLLAELDKCRRELK